MLYLAWDRENNISLFFASPLYENEAPGLEQAAIVTLATRVLRPLKRAFLTLTLIIQLDSSVLKENHKYICFFKWKFFGNWDPHLTRTMHTKVKFHESRFFSLLHVFFLYFPIFFSRQNWLLTKLLFSSFFAFSPFFRSGFTRCRVFLLLQRQRKRTIHVNWTFGSQTMEIKITKNGFSLLWALKQNCFFL